MLGNPSSTRFDPTIKKGHATPPHPTDMWRKPATLLPYLARVFIRKEGLPAAICGVVSANQLHLLWHNLVVDVLRSGKTRHKLLAPALHPKRAEPVADLRCIERPGHNRVADIRHLDNTRPLCHITRALIKAKYNLPVGSPATSPNTYYSTTDKTRNSSLTDYKIQNPLRVFTSIDLSLCVCMYMCVCVRV
jgi:hypothetical protein